LPIILVFNIGLSLYFILFFSTVQRYSAS